MTENELDLTETFHVLVPRPVQCYWFLRMATPTLLALAGKDAEAEVLMNHTREGDPAYVARGEVGWLRNVADSLELEAVPIFNALPLETRQKMARNDLVAASPAMGHLMPLVRAVGLDVRQMLLPSRAGWNAYRLCMVALRLALAQSAGEQTTEMREAYTVLCNAFLVRATSIRTGCTEDPASALSIPAAAWDTSELLAESAPEW